MPSPRHGLVWILIVLSLATWLFARDFGPEWKKDGDVYRREVTVPVAHYGGNVAGYQLKLANDMLHISDLDDNLGIIIERRPHEEFWIRKKKDGSVGRYRVVLNKVRYHDLDGDGTLDSMADTRVRPPKIFILLDGKWVSAQGARGDADMTVTRLHPDGPWHVFEDGRWQVRR